MLMMINRLFVYGILKDILENEDDAEFIEYRETPPEYTMYSFGMFPAVVEGGETIIKGKVFELTDNLLKRCDQIEGTPHLYRRELLDEDTYIYIYNQRIDGRMNHVVESGNW